MIRRIGAALVFVAAFLMLHATVQELDERAEAELFKQEQ